MAWIATVLLLVMVTTASASVIGIPRGTSTSLGFGGEDYRDGFHAGSGRPGGASAAAGLMEDAAADGLGYMSGVRLYSGVSEGDSGFSTVARGAGEEAARGGRRVVRQKPPGTVYDHIFNIPKTVLRTVNQGLNNRQTALMEGNRRVPSRNLPRRNRRLNSNRTSRRRATGSRRSGAASRRGRRPVNYDDIFNIPISTLDSVNQLLNNVG
ncbi:uncharacterized protein LOC126251753 isoform X1 [Schistocerca nitens]|uniref:uncharacterized protein LOC126251753 isoform X1 n=1 Tax=Schistocerca nitens TaxID=7011 RepID=UPI002117CAF3|nr:uncharacterized protein LOC126251753 isoform X1 [Schistocerca nitens]